MKIAFFETKPYEKEYLEKNLDTSFQKYFYLQTLNPDTIIDEEIKNCEIISTFVESDLSRAVLEKFPNLKFIVLRCVGYSHIDLPYAKEKGINIFNAPHYGDSSIAEYTFAMLLAATRKIPNAALDVKNQALQDECYQGMELKNKTLGIIGLGAIGARVAEIAKGFSLNILYYDIVKDDKYNFAEIDELCQKSDIISINCPLTSKTLHLIDENKFQLMKQGVVIVNTARGEIIKTSALYNALISKKVAAAALDVVECENILYGNEFNTLDINSIKENCLKNYYVTRKLLNMRNVLITPHIAYNTIEAKNRILEITVENLISSTKFTNGAKNLVLI